MSTEENNVVRLPGTSPPTPAGAANDECHDKRGPDWPLWTHRVKYGFRLALSIVLMWLQGPFGFICRVLSVVVWLVFFVLLLFKDFNTGPFWLLGSIGFGLFLLPLLLEFLIYWVMPTK